MIPSAQAKRKHDIYVLVLSSEHKVCPPGRYLAIVSTTVETSNPYEEIAMGMKLLGEEIVEEIFTVDDVSEPISDGKGISVAFLSIAAQQRTVSKKEKTFYLSLPPQYR